MPPQPDSSKHPLTILQSMINFILIETGKALRASDKESGKTLSHANARLRSTIPSATDNFHQALDEIETNIVRAKAVLTRDLEELRAKRLAADNLAAAISEDTATIENTIVIEDVRSTDAVVHDTLPPQQPVGEDNIGGKHQEVESNANNTGDAGKETVGRAVISNAENIQSAQPGPSDAVGLGIDTGEKPSKAEHINDTNDILNELFEMEASNNTAEDSNLNFDGMDFSLQGTDTTHNQTQDQSQLHSHEFDLSTFGDTAQVNSMTSDSTHNNEILDINNHQVLPGTTSGGQAENTDKQNLGNNIFDLGENVNGTDSMNIDFDTNMGGDDSMFDDLFFNTDDNNAGGGGGNSGQFDDAFFGLDN